MVCAKYTDEQRTVIFGDKEDPASDYTTALKEHWVQVVFSLSSMTLTCSFIFLHGLIHMLMMLDGQVVQVC